LRFYKLNITKNKSFREEHDAFDAYLRENIVIWTPDNVELGPIIGKVHFLL
jgi:hypothetical protein